MVLGLAGAKAFFISVFVVLHNMDDSLILIFTPQVFWDTLPRRNKMKTKQWISVVLIAISTALAGCASGYKEFYSSNTGIDQQRMAALRAAPPPAQPLVERASPGSSDEMLDAYTKRGYVMIGSSNFNSGRDVSEDGAVLQGKSVGADLVLILNPKYTGSVTSSIPITTPTTSTTYSNSTATAYGSGGSVTAYGSGVSTTYAHRRITYL